jgi:hypothetical protein
MMYEGNAVGEHFSLDNLSLQIIMDAGEIAILRPFLTQHHRQTCSLR